ncbi:MAG TPA: class I SAM-dependent methyltransferase [Pirellulaceae bacterium]|nr:class I SAM-dependent methyltransferase [Pirellulaceae bacterium]
MSTYRWSQAQFAAGYDAAAEFIHPRYTELQHKIIELLPFSEDQQFLLVDAGGGSGRLVAMILDRYPYAQAVVVDQSEPFLALAAERMRPFAGRGQTLVSRLQEDWLARLPAPPDVVVSMSSIHHLTPDEKLVLYQRIHDALKPGGVLMNGDEVRPADDATYLAELKAWDLHMRQRLETGEIPAEMTEILDVWRDKNLTHFGEPRKSGDDCHETVAVQLEYFRHVGFVEVDAPWQQEMWAILRGRKA